MTGNHDTSPQWSPLARWRSRDLGGILISRPMTMFSNPSQCMVQAAAFWQGEEGCEVVYKTDHEPLLVFGGWLQCVHERQTSIACGKPTNTAISFIA